ncbi:hypothetical protein HHL11_31645 [Ramlibacter sp. G-1-2-2]|uniref:Uncharacterized protein n=1 Tax=Ramlibacter agri TaxID=2728837 RepID=A0A848HC65_9BURK|nr:hypothetical protein [Ramlibacter agri]NML48345.1 hypothetical protein [Ramlibacter agri]
MSKYKVVITGRSAGASPSEVAAKLAAAFKLPQDKALELAQARSVVVRRGLDLQAAARYEQALAAAGCTVTVEPETPPQESLALDVGSSAPAPTASPAASEGETAAGQGNIAQVAGTLLTPLLMFALWVWFTEPAWLTSALSVVRGPNQLESVLRVGKSKSAEFEQFKMKGGLEAESRWKGFRVRAVSVSYRDSGELSMAQLRLFKEFPGYKLGSLDNFKSALRSECGGSWDVNANQTGMSAKGGNGVQCVVNGAGDDIEVMLALGEPQARSGGGVAVAAAAGAAAAPDAP